MLRLHRSTWLVLLLTLAAGVVANIGGDEHNGLVAFGWPWIFGRTEQVSYLQPGSGIWRVDQIAEWHWLWLAANVVTLSLLAATICPLWEWRCRKKRSWWQFSLADGFVYFAMACAAIAAWRYVYHDNFVEARLERALAQTSIRLHRQHNVPADWFWVTLRIPEERRAYRLTMASVTGEYNEDLSADVGAQLASCESLKTLTLRDICPPVIGRIPTFNNLTFLNVVGVSVSNDHVRYFSRTRRLKSLCLYYGVIDDRGLNCFAKNHELSSLFVEDNPRLQLAHLTTWSELEVLNLKGTGLSRAGCEAIAKLPKLQNLTIEDCERLTPEDWTILVRAPALDIVEFNGTFDDQAAAALAQSQSIRKVIVKDTQLTDAGIELLTKNPRLQVLRIRDRNSRLTDRSVQHLIDFHQRPREPGTYVASEIHLVTASPYLVRTAHKLQIGVTIEREP